MVGGLVYTISLGTFPCWHLPPGGRGGLCCASVSIRVLGYKQQKYTSKCNQRDINRKLMSVEGMWYQFRIGFPPPSSPPFLPPSLLCLDLSHPSWLHFVYLCQHYTAETLLPRIRA